METMSSVKVSKFDDNPRIVNAFQHWFAMAVDSTPQVLIDLYTSGDPDIMQIYHTTQRAYEDDDTQFVFLYRGGRGQDKDKILESWTRDRNLALEYAQMRGEGSEVVCCTFPIRQVLFDMKYVEEYFEAIDDALGMMPCDEVIIINREGQ